MWMRFLGALLKGLLGLLFSPFRFLSMLFGGGGARLDPQQAYQERVTVVEEREAEREAAVLNAQLDARRATLERILAEAQSPAGLEKPTDMEADEPEPEPEENEAEQAEMEKWIAAAHSR